MRKTLIAIAAAAAMVPAGAWAAIAAGEPDEDRTPIEQCNNLPASESIEEFTHAETQAICSEMLRVLEGVMIADLRLLSTATYLLSFNGYESEKYTKIARELVDIVRLRGLYDEEPRWRPTLEIVWKAWEGERGLISPRDIREFLASAGPEAARALSDEGLINMIAFMAVSRKRGEK
jgi:hypothetical protein